MRKFISLSSFVLLSSLLVACNDDSVSSNPSEKVVNEIVEESTNEVPTESSENTNIDDSLLENKLENEEVEIAHSRIEVREGFGLELNQNVAQNMTYYFSSDGLNNIILDIYMEDNFFKNSHESMTVGFFRDWGKNDELQYFEYTMGGMFSKYENNLYIDNVEDIEIQNPTNDELESLFENEIQSTLDSLEAEGLHYKTLLDNNPPTTYYDEEKHMYYTESIFSADQLNQHYPTSHNATLLITHAETGDGAILHSFEVSVQDENDERIYYQHFDFSKTFKEIFFQ